MKHNEQCPRPSSDFPCCADQMCPCDRDAFEELQKAYNEQEEESGLSDYDNIYEKPFLKLNEHELI